ncbi:von Willebrand factor A domain-containing protein 5A-like [Clarias gariepinus]
MVNTLVSASLGGPVFRDAVCRCVPVASSISPITKASHSKKSLPKRIKSWFGICRSFNIKQDVSLETFGDSTDPLLQIVFLQKASGYWEIDSRLADVFKRTKEELIDKIPEQVKPDVWATLLALIWLHGFKIDSRIEWHYSSIKAVAWLRTQKVVNLSECVRVGNFLLSCQVEEDAIGL